MWFNQNKNLCETINLPAGREVLVPISTYSREREYLYWIVFIYFFSIAKILFS